MVSVSEAKVIAMSFESVLESPHFDKLSFRVKNKIFATLDISKSLMVVKLNEIQQSVFIANDDTIIYPVSNTWGKQGWTTVELKKVRKSVLKDILKTAYCMVAPKKFSEKYN